MRRSSSRCPECGEPVSQFAAGCAICGTDLEAHRRRLAERRASAPSAVVSARIPAWLKWRPSDVHLMRLVLAIGLTLFAPFIGLFFAAWFAYHADQEGRVAIRNALIAVCGFAFVMLYVAPFSIWGVLLS